MYQNKNQVETKRSKQMLDPATLMIVKGIATGMVVLTILFIWAVADTFITLHYEEKTKEG